MGAGRLWEQFSELCRLWKYSTAFCLSQKSVCDFSADVWGLSGWYFAFSGHLICCLKCSLMGRTWTLPCQYLDIKRWLTLFIESKEMKITGLLLLFFFFRAFHWAHAKNPLTVLVDVIHGKTLKNGFLVLKNLIYYKSWVFLNIPIFFNYSRSLRNLHCTIEVS